MKTKSIGSTIAVRLDIGDEICSCIEKICAENNIKAGIVQGLGTTESAEIGVYDLQNRQFIANEVNDFAEISNLTGNVSQLNGKAYIHLHATLGVLGGKVYAGHLKKAIVGATAEIFITALDGEIERTPDNQTGLNIFDF